MPVTVQPEDVQAALGNKLNEVVSENLNLRATLEAYERTLAEVEQENSRLRKDAESPNGKVEKEMAPDAR